MPFNILSSILLQNEPLFFNIIDEEIKPIDICIGGGLPPIEKEEELAQLILDESLSLETMIDNGNTTEQLLNKNEEIRQKICDFDQHINSLENSNFSNGEQADLIIKYVIVSVQQQNLTEEIIDKSRVILNIKYKICMVFQNETYNYELINMPDDLSTKFNFKSNVLFPISYTSKQINRVLNIDLIDNYFVLNIDIPLNKFDNLISNQDFNNPSLQSLITVSNINYIYDTFLNNCTFGQHISIFVKCNVQDVIGIE